MPKGHVTEAIKSRDQQAMDKGHVIREASSHVTHNHEKGSRDRKIKIIHKMFFFVKFSKFFSTKKILKREKQKKRWTISKHKWIKNCTKMYPFSGKFSVTFKNRFFLRSQKFRYRHSKFFLLAHWLVRWGSNRGHWKDGAKRKWWGLTGERPYLWSK